MPALPDALSALRLDFAALLDQRGRLLQMETALPKLALVPERLVLREAVGEPFELVVDCVSTSAVLELKSLVGEQMTVLLLHADGVYRPWHGYVVRAAQLGTDGGLARYRLTMAPWLAFLGLRRDSFVYRDKTAREIVEDVFKDYSQANARFEVEQPMRTRSLCCQYDESDLDFVARLLAEEGLSYRFEHLQDEAAGEADESGRARHMLIVSDALAARPELGPIRFAASRVTSQRKAADAITGFTATRSVAGNAVTLGAWNYRQVAGTTGGDATALAIGELPTLEQYDGAGAYLYEHAEHAERAATRALAALELGYKRFEGEGAVRVLTAGSGFTLVDHPLHRANTTALTYAGAPAASRDRADNAFTVLAVEHHAANNLGAQAAELLGLSDVERGTYRNHFHAVPAAAALVPAFRRKPTAPGATTALVVGVEGEPLTTDREHRVKVQFHWQRGERPNAGGLSHASTVDPTGHAPGSDASGTWVRVALPAAGANWGAAFVPRLGTEVAVSYVEGDIDRPVVTGQLWNGADAPPFAAGEDSGVNHPGTISGLHTHRLDGGGYNQWVVDDATGQLRMRLSTDHAGSELGLGFQIQQPSGSAMRGAWRGSGFEATTRGWVTVRAGKGLLLSTTARAGTYGSATSTQMDSAEATAQLRAARELGERLGTAAKTAGAQPLLDLEASHGVEKLLAAVDPKKEGRHNGDVNGQPAMKAVGRETGSDAVEAFSVPLVLLDTPSAALFSSEAGIAHFAGASASIAAQGDLQQTAAHTWSAVSGRTASWYAHEGGIKAFAANGPVSLRAHTDALELWADKEVTVISVNNEITISARTKIEVVAGQSSVTLDGPNIEFRTPGMFEARASLKAFLGGGSGAGKLPPLPSGLAEIDHWVGVRYVDEATGDPIAGAEYEIYRQGAATLSGKLGEDGQAEHHHLDVNKVTKVIYKPRVPEADRPHAPLEDLFG